MRIIIKSPKSLIDYETDFAARMTSNQFSALGIKVKLENIITELKSLEYFNNLKEKEFNEKIISTRLKNSWSTENVLRSIKDLYDDDQIIFTLQWAFPQAYYSVFMSFCAYLNMINTELDNHSKVIKKFGEFIEQGKYPDSISFYASGVKPIDFHNISKSHALSSIHFDPFDEKSVDTQTCQFLKATREIDLNNKKTNMKSAFKTKRNKTKKSLSRLDWEKVSHSLGLTTVLSLLYRKRIKSNYDNIDTFVSPDIDPIGTFNSLIKVVNSLNFINESYISKLLNINKLKEIFNGCALKEKPFIQERLEIISTL